MPARTLRGRPTPADAPLSFTPSVEGEPRPGLEPDPEKSDIGGDRRRLVHLTTILVVATGLLLTVVLGIAVVTARDNNEERLFRQRTREAAAVLTAALPGIQTPLASSVEVVEESAGADQEAFRRLLTPLAEAGEPYVSASLWRADSDDPQPLLVIGDAPMLASQPPAEIRTFLERSSVGDGTDRDRTARRRRSSARVRVLLARASRASSSPTRRPGCRPIGPRSCPPTRRSAGLHFAVYLGDVEDPTQLLTASTPDLPLGGALAIERVAFGDTSLLLVMTPDGELGGTLLNILPWLVIAFGLVTTLGSATLTEWLLRRRDDAERLSEENARLYATSDRSPRPCSTASFPTGCPRWRGWIWRSATCPVPAASTSAATGTT